MNENTDTTKKGNRYADKAPSLFKFFFEDEDLSLNTFAVNLYESVRLVDLVFMVLMVQTNPYYKGLWIERRGVLITVVVAALIALFIGLFFARIIDSKKAAGYMQMVSILSIIIYPLCNTLVNMISYRSPTKALILFGFFEVIKFSFLYMMREGLNELINLEFEGKSNPKEDNFRALGQFTEDIIKFLSFTLFGWFISKFMGSLYIQKMNPYNYTVSFLILCLPLIVTWLLLSVAIAIDDDKDKKGDD